MPNDEIDDDFDAIHAAMPWATEEDRRLARADAYLYGNAYVMKGTDGKVRRIDPATIRPTVAPLYRPDHLGPMPWKWLDRP